MDSSCSKGGACKEALKLQKHLELLRGEFKKLQNQLALASTTDKTQENSFLSSLYKTVSGLHETSAYSDFKIKLKGSEISVHKLVFLARSNDWDVPSLETVDSLDWSEMDRSVASALIKWIYTDQVDFLQSDEFKLSLMKYASKFQLKDLVNRSERALIGSVNVKNCIMYYTTADEIGAEDLKDHCSNLISTYWDDFTSTDFEYMSDKILYQMLKTKTKFPLHAAVRLKREDVVFQYLIEHSDQTTGGVNMLDTNGDLPLGIALQNRDDSIALTLLDSGAVQIDFRDKEGWTLLHKAVDRGDDYAAKFLIKHGASVELVTFDTGNTALHMIATGYPDSTIEETLAAMVEVAKLLLSQGLDPNIQNKTEYTALHLAVLVHNEELFNLLLATPGIDLNLRTEEGHTPLWFALLRSTNSQLYNCNGFVARLIEKGATPNPIYPQNGNSLLHLVASEKLEEAGLFLCNYIFNFDHINRQGETALHVACMKDLGRLVTKLLECGANPNIQTICVGLPDDPDMPAYRLSPLHMAISAKCKESVKAFLEHKVTTEDSKESVVANLNLRDSGGNTPLTLALKFGFRTIIPDLIKAGADINMRDTNGLTLLHLAIKEKDITTAIYLLNQGANMDAKTGNDETPLELAILENLPEVVEALCRRGVSDMAVDKQNSPLWTALNTGKEEIASILIRHGIDSNCWQEGPEGCHQTLLHRAIDENKEKIAKFLIQSGCDLNSPRRAGPGGRGGDEAHDEQTPLHLCCQWGLESVVQTLVEHGANTNVKDADGKTPLHIAIQNQHPSIIHLLLCHPYIDLTVPDKNGLTPFATALQYRNIKAAEAMKAKLPSVSEQFDSMGNNFLHSAILKLDVESVLFLLSIGVDVNSRVRDANQSTPLHLAALKGNELIVRSLLLDESIRANDRDAHKRTPLHIAAEAGHEAVTSALLQNNAEYDAVDSEGDNALHVAVREGHFAIVKALLTESKINAEAVNLKGRNPLHTLARYAKDNAASIFELFIECMPNYPLDKPDLDENTALILAYTKGHGNLCRALVKAHACIGVMNSDGVTIFNYQVASNSKTLLKSLLDSLSEEPPWVDGDICLECGTKFSLTSRKHHCRHCGRLLCSRCSDKEMPILKFNINKPVRVCEVCFDLLQVGV